jgi:membrane protease YdiL (CAAX protease family)
MSLLLNSICSGSRHVELSFEQALFYCSVLALSYVASLYCLVPTKIRKLHRDDSLQIRWRALASSIVCTGAMLTYRPLFCDKWTTEFVLDNLSPKSTTSQTFYATVSVLFHTTILYFGTVTRSFIVSYESLMIKDGKVQFFRFFNEFYALFIDPCLRPGLSKTNSERWTFLRNLVIAPLTEEIVFRSCMVPVLHSTKMSNIGVCVIAPLFFGFAHVHHAILKLRQGYPFSSVVVTTFFQFMYTSLFGAYVSYTFLRTGSLCAVVLCHTMCNAMGLPNLSFLQHNSGLYRHRQFLTLALILGIFGFIIGLTSLNLPPATMIAWSEK